MNSKSGVTFAVLIIIVIITVILTSVGLRVVINKQYFKKSEAMKYNSNYESYKTQLEDYISNKQYETNARYNEYELNADKDSVYYKGEKQEDLTIKDIIPSILEEDLEKVTIENGELVFNE